MTYTPDARYHSTAFSAPDDEDLYIRLATPRPLAAFRADSAPRFIGVCTADEMDEIFIPAEIEVTSNDAFNATLALQKAAGKRITVGGKAYNEFIGKERSQGEAILDIAALIKQEDDVLAYRRWYFSGGLGHDPLSDILRYRQFTQVEGLTYKCLDEQNRDVTLTLDPQAGKVTLAWHRAFHNGTERFETHDYRLLAAREYGPLNP